MGEILVTKEMLKDLTISDLLDMDMDSIEDATGFALPPKGMYQFVILAAELKNTAKEGEPVREAIVIDMEVKATVELSDPAEKPLADGAKVSTSYMGAQGAQFFKTEWAEVAKSLGTKSLKEFLPALSGVGIACMVGHRLDKRDPKDIKTYPTFKDIVVA